VVEDPDNPSVDIDDCTAVWTCAHADPHAWLGCSRPNCPRELAARLRAEGLVAQCSPA
jgi:hypothetical protein